MPATLEPIGFWSYARSDDDVSNRRLSTLRGLLRAELKLHWGRREVRIWQDLEAIAYGTTWLAEIEQAIAESSFLIPIVTRAFLESKMCCQEVTLFHQRQLALGRNDVIFPFHFTDVTRVRAEDCEDPAVLTLLQERQAFDFSRLRLRDPHSEEVATKLASLAAAIDDTLRRTHERGRNQWSPRPRQTGLRSSLCPMVIPRPIIILACRNRPGHSPRGRISSAPSPTST
jgi:hypothetical protein